MDLPSVEYESLAQSNCAFIDSSTLQILMDNPLSWFLFHEDSSVVRSEGLRARLHTTRDQINSALDLLARMVAYDYLVVDGSIFASRWGLAAESDGELVANDLVRRTTVPDDVYVGASRNVIAAAEALGYDPRDHPDTTDAAHWLKPEGWYDFLEKWHIDQLYERVRTIRWIADSDQSALRALYYLELARFAAVPVFLSREKERNVRSFGGKLVVEALRIVQARLDDAVFNQLKQGAESAYGTEFRLDWPPLVRYIVAISQKHRISLFEAMLRVRGMRAAVEFRRWLGKLQRLLLAVESSGALMEAEKILHDLSVLAEQWGDECDAGYGVRFAKGKASIGEIPGIGFVLRLAGKADASFKDPILNRTIDHVSFVADWYEAVPRESAG